MKIVIDIPKEYYKDICNSQTASNYSVLEALDGIRNGTPLTSGKMTEQEKATKKHREEATTVDETTGVRITMSRSAYNDEDTEPWKGGA